MAWLRRGSDPAGLDGGEGGGVKMSSGPGYRLSSGRLSIRVTVCGLIPGLPGEVT